MCIWDFQRSAHSTCIEMPKGMAHAHKHAASPCAFQLFSQEFGRGFARILFGHDNKFLPQLLLQRHAIDDDDQVDKKATLVSRATISGPSVLLFCCLTRLSVVECGFDKLLTRNTLPVRLVYFCPREQQRMCDMCLTD